MKVQFKQFEGQVKSWNDSDLILEHFISTEMQDSGGDIMLADGMKLRGKPVVLFQHGLDSRYGNEPIAKVLDIKVGEFGGKKGLVARTQYYDGSHLTPPDNTGRRLYEKAKDGTMPNWSIGFNSIKEKPIKGGRVVEEWELHEYSQVAVGMNSEACTLSSSAPELKFVIKDDTDGATEKPGAPEGEVKPNPSKFDTEGDFMKECVPMMVKEGKDQDQAVAACLNIWKNRGKAGDVPDYKAKEDEEDEEMETSEPKPGKPDKVDEKGSVYNAHMRAHKALHSLHKCMVSDLEDVSKSQDIVKVGAEKCAKDALEEFSENVHPHVKKYVKCIKKMKPEDRFEDEDVPEENEEEEEDTETKGHVKCRNSLRKCLKEMVGRIRAHRGKEDVDDNEATDDSIQSHEKAALPHAIELVREIHKKKSESEEPKKPKKPAKKPAKEPEEDVDSDSADEDKTLRVISDEPPTEVKTFRVVTPAPEQPVKIMAEEKSLSNEAMKTEMKELFKGSLKVLQESFVNEMRRASGKVTR